MTYPYEGPAALQPAITAALGRVQDPEVGLGILDVGLVYGVTANEGLVRVLVTMTSAACPLTETIVHDIENELDAELPPEWKIQVALTWEPPWTPDRMSAQGRRAMGW